MNDEPDHSDRDESTAETTDSGPPEIAADHSVPEGADWRQVVQKPVGEAAYSGLTTTIIAAIADAEGIQPREVQKPVLYDVVDTAALEAAFFDSDERIHVQSGDASAEFMYRGYRVVVQSDGWVRVYERVED